MNKYFPGADNGDLGHEVGQFSEHRVSFDAMPDTHHQTAVIMTPNTDDQEFLNRADKNAQEMLRRISNPELIALRSQNPFIEIAPFPMQSLWIVANQNNDVRDVTLPRGTQMIRFSVMRSVEYFVGVNGQVAMPPPEDLTGGGPLYCPSDTWYYVRGLRNLSIGIALNNTGVCIQCHIQN